MSAELIDCDILNDIITAVVNGEKYSKTDDVKLRTVYLLKRTDKPDDGTDIYVGSTSLTLTRRLQLHRSAVSNLKKYGNTKLYVRMREVASHNWEVLPLLSFTCDKETILGFEKEWCEVLDADLNTSAPIITEEEKREYGTIYYQSNRESILQKHKQHYGLNKESILQKQKQHYDLNKESILQRQAKYRELNRESILQKQNQLYFSKIQNKVYHCDVCDKSFQSDHKLQKHLYTIKHGYAYLNSLD